MIMNPPYNERLEYNDINVFYKAVGDQMKQAYSGWEAWIISSNKEALKHIGLRPSRKVTLYNGALECKFHKFELYKGTKKVKEEAD
jgi:putative N6-adenine-specific DNA methylase